MIEWIYKWFPIIFGCHCKDNRSFYYKGKKFPLCARCTGELIGIFVGIILYIIIHPTWKLSCILLIPLIVDGFVQRLTSYESNNIKRVITGFLFGCGIVFLFLIFTINAVQYGYHIGDSIFN